MDWNKAKTILIIALVVTNVVLAGTLFFRASGNSEADDEILMRILLSSNVSIEAALPKKPGKMAMLYVQPESVLPESVEAVLAEQKPITGLSEGEDLYKAVRDQADKLMEMSGLTTVNTRYDQIVKENGELAVIYRDVFGDVPIEESYVRCSFKNGRFYQILRKWYVPIGLHSRKGEVISPVNALMQLLPDKDEDEILVVRKVELVYWVNSHEINTALNDTALPAWKITDSTGKIRYVAGF